MKRIIKPVLALFSLNVIWILFNAYIDLSFYPIINKLFFDPTQEGYRAGFILVNILMCFAVTGYFLPDSESNNNLTK